MPALNFIKMVRHLVKAKYNKTMNYSHLEKKYQEMEFLNFRKWLLKEIIKFK